MSFNGLLNQTVTVYSEGTSRDKQGRLTAGAGTSHRARVERTSDVMLTATKEAIPIDAIMFIAASATLKEGLKVDYAEDSFRIMKYSEVVGRNGLVHHYEVKAQKWSA